MRKGQVSLEYIILIAAVLIIAGAVVWIITSSAAAQKEAVIISTCKQTATECKIIHLVNPSDPCNPCVDACSDPTTGEEVFEGAIACCRLGQPENIYSGALGCGAICEEGETQDCTTSENCPGISTCTDGSWGECVDIPNDNCPLIANEPPVVSTVSPMVVYQGSSVRFNITASDSDGISFCMTCINSESEHPSCYSPLALLTMYRVEGDKYSGKYSSIKLFDVPVDPNGQGYVLYTFAWCFDEEHLQGFGPEQYLFCLPTAVPPENLPPIADFTANPTSGEAPLVVHFDASDSSDPDGTIVSYDWDFRDGETGSGVTIAHTYTEEGIYIVTLTVTDDDGATDTATETITVTS